MCGSSRSRSVGVSWMRGGADALIGGGNDVRVGNDLVNGGQRRGGLGRLEGGGGGDGRRRGHALIVLGRVGDRRVVGRRGWRRDGRGGVHGVDRRDGRAHGRVGFDVDEEVGRGREDGRRRTVDQVGRPGGGGGGVVGELVEAVVDLFVGLLGRLVAGRVGARKRSR